MTCPACSETIPGNAERCPSCGAEIDFSATPTATGFAHQPVSSRIEYSSPETTPRSPQVSHVFAPGAVIAGRYRVVNLLGKGGMGEVYRADDLTLGQPVAMKFLPRKLASDQAALARFHSEVRVARNVAHPNVCRVFDIGESEGRIFLTMEYIDGEDLSSLLRRIGRLPSDKATELSRQICAGVAAAHDAGILHRDLKPANIMVDGRGRAHVTDFGLAGLAVDLKEDASRAGTPAYMAPEQLAGQGVTVQSDIFSLGLILYEMFTGKRAFNDETIAGLMRAHQDSAPSRPSTLIGDIDARVERVILQCLERNPAARPRTALDVARALPGGDPLAAALAAGETPSPEMVAASGGVGALPLGKAWAMLAATLLCFAAMVVLTPWSTDLGLAPLENSPDVMSHRAQELARKFGYKDAPADTAFWYERNVAFLSARAKNLPRSLQIGDLKSAPQGHTKFYFRQSPREMYPRENRRDLWTPGLILSREFPPHTVPGMVMIGLEPDGSLDQFVAVPPQLSTAPEKDQTSAPDWNALFAESGLDPKRFETEAPIWISPVPFDAIMGWKGSYAQDPGTPIHVSAAAFQGRPVYFQVIAPWNNPERAAPLQESKGVRLAAVAGPSITFVLLAAGIFLVLRNLARRRADLKGAVRLSLFFITALMMAWFFLTHHQTAPDKEYALFMDGIGHVLWYTLMNTGAYLAMEPYVRRRFPEMITSWTRLVSGDWRDALVGQHVLTGVLAGALFSVIRSVGDAYPVWFNTRGQISRQFYTTAMTSLPGAIGVLAGFVSTRTLISLALVFTLFLFRVVSKRRWVAVLATMLVFAPLLHRPATSTDDAPFALLWAFALAMLASRVGLVALPVFEVTQTVLQGFPLTFHPADWYFSRTVIGLTLCLILAIYGFYTSLGGQPALGSARGILAIADE